MDYTSERKNKADDQMTKATRRFKKYKAKSAGDYGDVPAEYATAAPGPTYDHEMRSGVDMIEDELMNEQHILLRGVLAEAVAFNEARELKSTDPKLNCAVCGDKHPTSVHPQAIHTAKALAGEGHDWHHELQEAARPSPADLQKASIFKKVDGKEVLDELGEAEKKISKTHPSYKQGYQYGTDYNLGSKPRDVIGRVSMDQAHHTHLSTKKSLDQRCHAINHFAAGATDAARERGLVEVEEDFSLQSKESTSLWEKLTEAKKKKNNFKSNRMTISTTPEDIRRKAMQTVGTPPAKKVIKSKLEKKPKYKENFYEAEINEASPSIESVLASWI
jgi:hypothetical protein